MNEKTIDGNLWTCTLMDSESSLELSVELAQLLGPGLSAAIGQMGDGQSRAAAGAGLVVALSKAEPKRVKELARKVLRGVTMDGEPLFLDGPKGQGAYATAFRGRLLVMFKVMAWVISQNLGDFTGVFGKPADEASGSETTFSQTGMTSGASGSSPAP